MSEPSETKGNVTEYRASRRRKINVFKLAAVVIAILVMLYFGVSIVKIVNLSIEKNRVEMENERLRNQKEDLEQKLEIVNSNDYLESLARNKLRLVKGNEILFILPSFRSAPDDEQLTPEEELFRLRLKEAEEKAMREAEAEKKGQTKEETGESSDAADATDTSGDSEGSDLESGVGAVISGATGEGDGND